MTRRHRTGPIVHILTDPDAWLFAAAMVTAIVVVDSLHLPHNAIAALVAIACLLCTYALANIAVLAWRASAAPLPDTVVRAVLAAITVAAGADCAAVDRFAAVRALGAVAAAAGGWILGRSITTGRSTKHY